MEWAAWERPPPPRRWQLIQPSLISVIALLQTIAVCPCNVRDATCRGPIHFSDWFVGVGAMPLTDSASGPGSRPLLGSAVGYVADLAPGSVIYRPAPGDPNGLAGQLVGSTVYSAPVIFHIEPWRTRLNISTPQCDLAPLRWKSYGVQTTAIGPCCKTV